MIKSFPTKYETIKGLSYWKSVNNLKDLKRFLNIRRNGHKNVCFEFNPSKGTQILWDFDFSFFSYKIIESCFEPCNFLYDILVRVCRKWRKTKTKKTNHRNKNVETRKEAKHFFELCILFAHIVICNLYNLFI